MAFPNWPYQGSPSVHSISGGGILDGGGWGGQQRNEALFNSLHPIGGMVTGEQVKPVFQASGLPQAKLAQIWGLVDRDRDGRINFTEFCMAMGLLQQARQELAGSFHSSSSSQPTSFFQRPVGGQQFPLVPSTPPPSSSQFPLVPSTPPSTPLSSSSQLPKSWTMPPLKRETSASSLGGGGVGRGVSLNVVSGGWGMKPDDRRRYIMQFNTLDKTRAGFLSGAEVRPILTKSDLDQSILAQIWGMSDLDKDGRLNAEEFAIAMHLLEKAKQGLTLPKTLPSELRPTLERTRKFSEEKPLPVTFEDRLKENFEQGRQELERRRRARLEQQEREKAERERKKREEEERRLQQEREAEVARQAELERQHKKALEIEREREYQMQKLAMQREAEQRELERRRKEEWARKRQREMEGQREWERKTLRSLRAQRSELEQQLNQLDQKKLGLSASLERQKGLCSELSHTLQSLRVSQEVRRAELSKIHSELNGFQERLSSLEKQRRELQQALQARSPESLAFQQQRQQYRDGVMGLAAALAGLRSTFSHHTKTHSRQQEHLKIRNKTVEELKLSLRSEEGKVRDLRLLVASRKRVWEEHQRKVKEAAERQAEMERKQREEKERLQRIVEERAHRVAHEVRLVQIKKQQEKALKEVQKQKEAEKEKERERERQALEKRKHTSPVTPNVETPEVMEDEDWLVVVKPSQQQPPEPEGKKEMSEKDRLIKKKVQELRAEMQKQKELKKEGKKKPPPMKPTPYKPKSRTKEEEKRKDESTGQQNQPLLDLSSWDSGPQQHSVVKLQADILQPLRALSKPSTPSELAKTQPERPQPKERTPPRKPLEKPPLKPKPTLAERTPQRQPAFKMQTRPAPNEETPEPRTKRIPSVVTKAAATQQLSQVHAGGSADEQVTGTATTSNVSYAAESRSQELKTATDETIQSQEQVAETLAAAIQYRALYDFDASDSTEVSFREGDFLTLCPGAEVSPGWVMVEGEGERGWAPESYLEQVEGDVGVEEGGGTDRSEGEAGVLSPPPILAQVIFSWKGSKDNHLTIPRGEIVTVLQQGDKWWSGELNGQVGWFPKTFVRILEEEPKPQDRPAFPHPPSPQPSTPKLSIEMAESGGGEGKGEQPAVEEEEEEQVGGVVYEAVYDYEGEAEGDLEFRSGDQIQVISQQGEWWTGILNGVQGIFPSNYVQLRGPQHLLSPTGSISSTFSEHHTITVCSKTTIARVLVAFHGQREGQLSLSPGEYIRVRKQATNGWWEGELQSRGKQRKAGWFPANRVELLQRGNPSTSTSSLRARSPLLEPPVSSAQTLVLALYSYTAVSPDELSFHKGSVITVLSKEEGEWWKGELNGQVGLFPYNYVQTLSEQQPSEATRWAESVSQEVLAAISEKERKRQEAIFELFSSERNYVDSLKLVVEVFFDPMSESGVLTDEEMRKVRVNWDELLEYNSKLLNAFLVRLRTSGAVVRSIGDLLANQIPILKPHIRWCSCQLTACTLLHSKSSDPQFREFEQKCMQDPRTGGLPLSSFLLKPMQRITKYPLLIKRILEYTPEGDMDHEELQASLEQAESLCTLVNEAVRSKENTEQLEWLQTHVQFTLDEHLVFNSQTNFMGSRKLLHWGKLFKIRGGRDLVGFLFNDFILLVKPKLFFPRAATPADLEPFSKNEFQMYRKPFILEGLRVKKAPPDHYGPSVFLLLHTTEEKEIPLRVESDYARDQWVKKTTHACLDYIQTKKRMEREKKQKLLRTLKDSVGMLKVTVVEAADLLASDPNGKSDPFCVVKLGEIQELRTDVIPATLNPRWNHSMEFAVHDVNKDMLEITVFDKDLFSPNDFLGTTRLALKDLLRDGDCPWTKRLLLEDVSNGEIELKIELQLNKSDLLL